MFLIFVSRQNPVLTPSECALQTACISSPGHIYGPASDCLVCVKKKKDGDSERGEKAVVKFSRRTGYRVMCQACSVT